MLLDKLLLDRLGLIGKNLAEKANLKQAPNSVKSMTDYLTALKESIENEDFDGLLLGLILFEFVTKNEIRDRKVTSRIFEDIFSGLFSTVATDISTRSNPAPSNELIALDSLCINDDWNISSDLSGNKREKADLDLNGYKISLKTLKGKSYDSEGYITDNSLNQELNVGSLSFRALLKGIIDDESISKLKDRKGGLGSANQIRRAMLNPINESNCNDKFLERLELFLKYVYSEDIYIVLKSNFKIFFYLIPSNSFIDSITKLYDKKEYEFEKVWNRWENNNLRFRWLNLINYLNEFQLSYSFIEINLAKAVKNHAVIKFLNKVSESIELNLEEMLN